MDKPTVGARPEALREMVCRRAPIQTQRALGTGVAEQSQADQIGSVRRPSSGTATAAGVVGEGGEEEEEGGDGDGRDRPVPLGPPPPPPP